MVKSRGHGEGTVFERQDRPGTWRAIDQGQRKL